MFLFALIIFFANITVFHQSFAYQNDQNYQGYQNHHNYSDCQNNIYTLTNKEIKTIGVLKRFVKTQDIQDIISNQFYKNKKEFIFNTKNIAAFSKHNLHAITYINQKSKELFIFIRGTKIYLSTSIFDQSDIDDCIRLQKNQQILKYHDLQNLANFLCQNIPLLHQYKIIISGHSLGAVCSDILAILIKKIIAQKYYFYPVDISSVTFDNPGSLRQIQNNKYSFMQVRRFTHGIKFIIIQNGKTPLNSSLPRIRNQYIQIEFLLDKYKPSQNTINNLSSQARNLVIDFFANMLSKKISNEKKYVTNNNLHLLENIYAGTVLKFHKQNPDNIQIFLEDTEVYFTSLIEKQNKKLNDFNVLNTLQIRQKGETDYLNVKPYKIL